MRLLQFSTAFTLLLVSIPLLAADIERSFDVASGGSLKLRSDLGSVEIYTHDKARVDVEVDLKGLDDDEFEVNFEQDGSDLGISAKKQSKSWGWNKNAKFTITVPDSYNLDLGTGGGSIDIDGLQGDVEAKTSGGSIKLGMIDGNVEVRTSGGSIRIEEVAGNIDAHTSGGSVRASISKQPDENCRLTTSGGSIAVYLEPSIAVDLTASTNGGRVSSEFDVDGSVGKTKIKGQINGGGPDLFLSTSGGSVSVNKL